MQWKIPGVMFCAAAVAVAVIPPAAPRQPVIHEVTMVTDGKTYRFAPATLAIKAGDQVKFLNVSGGPHNIAFDPEKVGDEAEAKLGAAMKDQIAPLAGPLMSAANEAYVVSFAGVPAGRYEYFCMPHLAMGMTGAITVE